LRDPVIILMSDNVMRVPKIMTLLSVIIFVASLTQSCYNTEGHDPQGILSRFVFAVARTDRAV